MDDVALVIIDHGGHRTETSQPDNLFLLDRIVFLFFFTTWLLWMQLLGASPIPDSYTFHDPSILIIFILFRKLFI